VSRKPDERAPVAPHRLSPRGWTRVFTFLFVFVAGGGIAYGAIWYLDQNSDGNFWDFIPFLASDPEPSVAPSFTAAEPTFTPSATPSATVEPEYDYSVKVTIYYSSSDSALGKDIAAYLGDISDFSKISSKKWSGARPPANVVRFEDPALAETAAHVAELLGIQTVASGPTSGPDIAVVLIEDPRPQPETTVSPSASASP
jgi:hypothetical protein